MREKIRVSFELTPDEMEKITFMRGVSGMSQWDALRQVIPNLPERKVSSDEAAELAQALAGMLEMFEYVSQKIDWGKSWMDNKAIQLMNEKPIEAWRALAKFTKREESEK